MIENIEVRFRGLLGRFMLDAEFSVPARGITGIFGPSGCGKTSVLRCIAGLQRVPDGVCRIEGEVWQDANRFVPVHRRPIGYVFQEASLFPHLSVTRNLLFGAGKTGAGGPELAEIADLLGIAHLLDRAPRNLSGGERQRVAVGRALLSNPRLLLMDEPLSALDRATKSEILPFLEGLHETLRLPILYVSHDMAEIERLADHLVLMENGRVIASGPLADLQSDPGLPLAASSEAAVSLDARVVAHDAENGLLVLEVDGGRFITPGTAAVVGSRKRIRVGAGDISLSRQVPGPSTILNVLPARVLSSSAAGEHEVAAVLGLGLDGAGARLVARVTRKSWTDLALADSAEVFAQIKGVALRRA
ncbi:molybdenum ABC transporter ATP-binding protein [Terrihabitans rhizophilus]|uniref:Molybdenum ABC transporter ATP-binding protein n=1 Tax=Terrihabitans rhizophilus TaxID=3092662 RepID=A0ABU4RPC0_9HYPH|nr:molybdenum ABC transporter ATP-binding protein [Terrihabitans sp. PJ23]MDX6806456.1 molybdenum ABC transporter ATP-binding protein [Terrihabitans sp. PJ23]